MAANSSDKFRYEIVKPIAVLSESPKGWTKEFNLVSWNGNEPKYDIREWAPDKSKCGKGITLTDEEIEFLKKALESCEL
ncbi:MAG: PC4/YdbC family ssDNA-binding protein [archaeon]|nr:PC4/YdbC family ssDNA-binding protein [archaeon]